MQENKKGKTIFISHRSKDRDIANFLRAQLVGWLDKEDRIFQSTVPGQGPEIGRELTKELKAVLMKTNLLFLIYSDSSADWGYCLWECGFADAPTTVTTKFVVLQLGDESHPVFSNLLRVQLERESIKDFIKQFHTKDKFIPGFDKLSEGIDEDVLNTWADTLYNGLKEKLPKVTPEILSVWDCMVLKLQWEPLLKITKLKESKDKDLIEKAKEIIFNNCTFESKRSTSLQHFGFVSSGTDKSWKEVLSNWMDNSESNTPHDWIDNLHSQLYRSIFGQAPKIIEGEFISLAPTEIKRYCPILTRVRKWFSGDIDFDIFFYPIA